MALKLDEDYNGSTLLSTWWQKVKSNFAAVTAAVNANESAIKSLAGACEQLNKDLQQTTVDLMGEISGLEKNKVDKTQYASTAQYGLVKLKDWSGLDTSNGGLEIKTQNAYGLNKNDKGMYIKAAEETDIAAKTSWYKPLVPAMLDYAVIKSAHGQYSTSPVQIGEWFDSTPVWRVVIGLTPMSDIGINANNAEWYVNAAAVLEKLGIVADDTKIIHIGDGLHFQCTESYYTESFALGVSSGGSGVYNAVAQEEDFATHFYGWIEFATPKSNIPAEV